MDFGRALDIGVVMEQQPWVLIDSEISSSDNSLFKVRLDEQSKDK